MCKMVMLMVKRLKWMMAMMEIMMTAHVRENEGNDLYMMSGDVNKPRQGVHLT